MFVTGDATEYRAYTKGCTPCARLADRVEGYYAAGGWIKTTPWRFKSLRIVTPSKLRPVLGVETQADPTRYKESSTGSLKRFPGGSAHFNVSLRRTAEGWTISNYVRVPK